MDETKNSLAIILNRSAYRENDSLITAYTINYGKLTLVARGTQKLSSKLAGHIEPLTLADIMIINGKGFDYIGSAIMRESYSGIREDLNKLYYAGRAIGIFNRFIKENQTDERLFFLLTRWLKVLNDFFAPQNFAEKIELDKNSGELLWIFFVLKLLAELGHKPEVYKCLSCSKTLEPSKNYFSFIDGGIICGQCFVLNRQDQSVNLNFSLVSDNCIKIMRFIMDNDFEMSGKLKADKKLIKELYSLVNNFLGFQF